MRSVFRMCAVLAFTASSAMAQYGAELIHFTDDGTETGNRLLPGFLHHSCWSGIGASSAGNIYITASNHQQPGGNVAVYKYDPVAARMSLLGDIKLVSQAVDNWMPAETQHKVHTFLMEHADGRIYFASDDYDPSPFLRGSHLYYIDPATDSIHDFSKTQPYLMERDFNVIANTGQNAERSGVFIEYFGIKGISLNPRAADLIYAMTYPEGHIIKYRLSDGGMEKVGISNTVSYVFYTANNGDLYYSSQNGSVFEFKKYDLSEGTTTVIESDLGDRGFSMMAPTASGDTCYFLTSAKDIYRLICPTDEVTFIGTFCGTNWATPGLFNMTLNADGSRLYITTLAATEMTKRTGYVDLLDNNTCYRDKDTVGTLVGNRGLAFGGVNTWDKSGNYYLPVWEFGQDTTLAVLKVTAPVTGTAAIDPAAYGLVAVPAESGVRLRTNPVVNGTAVDLIMTSAGHADLAVYSAAGIRVKTLAAGSFPADRHVVYWNGSDDNGRLLTDGVYFLRLNGGEPVRFMVAR